MKMKINDNSKIFVVDNNNGTDSNINSKNNCSYRNNNNRIK